MRIPPQQFDAPPCSLPPQHELCETPEDFVARRTRLAFLDRRACQQALPKVGRGAGVRDAGVWRNL